MSAGLESLVRGLFDYAGLFPPANLPLDEALRVAASLPRTLQRPSLVGADFVCDWTRLAQLLPGRLAATGWPPGRRFGLCVLGPAWSGVDAPGPDGHRKAIDAAIAAEEGAAGLRALSYEAKCPVHAVDARARESLEAVAKRLAGWSGAVYLEPECPGPLWPESVDRVLDFFDSLPGSSRPGLKVRCAGPSGVDPESLARLIAGACDRRLGFKLTAGLHHPFASPEGRWPIGFVGAALAVRLRRAHGAGASVGALQSCLSSSDPLQFSFDDGASWLEFRLSAEALRAGGGASIGSCSLHEPDEELAALYPTRGAGRTLDKSRDRP